MNERRITPGTDNRHDPLKEIAGRLQSLSYRDMQRLSHLLLGNIREVESASQVSETLLATADEILTEGAR